MPTKELSSILEPYNFFTFSPNTTLQEILTILSFKEYPFAPIIIKENNKVLGTLLQENIIQMVIQANKSGKDFSYIIVETFLSPLFCTLNSSDTLRQALSLFKEKQIPFIGILNNEQILISTLSLPSLLKELPPL